MALRAVRDGMYVEGDRAREMERKQDIITRTVWESEETYNINHNHTVTGTILGLVNCNNYKAIVKNTTSIYTATMGTISGLGNLIVLRLWENSYKHHMQLYSYLLALQLLHSSAPSCEDSGTVCREIWQRKFFLLLLEAPMKSCLVNQYSDSSGKNAHNEQKGAGKEIRFEY